jgi:hypothetical protein
VIGVGGLHEHRLQRVGSHLVGLREGETAALLHCAGVLLDLLREVDQRDDDGRRRDHLADRPQVLQGHSPPPRGTPSSARTR